MRDHKDLWETGKFEQDEEEDQDFYRVSVFAVDGQLFNYGYASLCCRD